MNTNFRLTRDLTLTVTLTRATEYGRESRRSRAESIPIKALYIESTVILFPGQLPPFTAADWIAVRHVTHAAIFVLDRLEICRLTTS